MKFTIPKLRDTAILLGWITGLLCAAGLCWFLTKSLRTELLQQSINRAWQRTGNSYQLESPVTPAFLKQGLSRLGAWYNMSGGNKALVFTVIADGVFLPCIAVINKDQKVEEIVPLSSSGDKLFGRISPGIIKLYIRRIEGVL